MVISRVHNIIGGESILLQYSLYKRESRSYDAIPIVTFNVLVGQAFAQPIATKIVVGWASISKPLEVSSTLKILKSYPRETSVLLKFFILLHHNFVICICTGYTEVGYSPPIII